MSFYKPLPVIAVLSFDPSSSAMGFAEHTSNAEINVEPALVEAGLIKPERVKDDANTRIEKMVRACLALVRELRPDLIIVEDTSGKVAGRHGGKGAGLAIYGKAVGWLLCACKVTGVPVVAWLENDWTKGERKSARIEKCRALHPDRYDPAADPGGDTADAVMMGRAYCFRRLYENRELKK